jgi:hypothetical protein
LVDVSVDTVIENTEEHFKSFMDLKASFTNISLEIQRQADIVQNLESQVNEFLASWRAIHTC